MMSKQPLRLRLRGRVSIAENISWVFPPSELMFRDIKLQGYYHLMRSTPDIQEDVLFPKDFPLS